jgi:quercetin dioxygenase-like cupin family protein
MSETKEKTMDGLSESVIFPIGEKFNSDRFNGTVWMNMLTPAGSALPIANVTFEPGCRNNWHSHAGGQVLLVTGGRGYYQEWEKPARELRAGDVVEIPADVKHWHGAARDSWFAHIAIEVDPKKGPATWMEPVSDEDYNALK